MKYLYLYENTSEKLLKEFKIYINEEHEWLIPGGAFFSGIKVTPGRSVILMFENGHITAMNKKYFEEMKESLRLEQ